MKGADAMTAKNLDELEAIASREGKEGEVPYAFELHKLLTSVGAEDRPGDGTWHTISVGKPGSPECLFSGQLNITRQKILPRWKNAYELALEATIIKYRGGGKRARDSRDGTFVINWLERGGTERRRGP